MIHPDYEQKLLEKQVIVKNCTKFLTDLLEYGKNGENDHLLSE